MVLEAPVRLQKHHEDFMHIFLSLTVLPELIAHGLSLVFLQDPAC